MVPRRRPRPGPLVLAIRWGLPLAFVILGLVLLIMAHFHLTGVQDNAAEANVFTTTRLSHDSLLSTIGVASIVVAMMVALLNWMLRLNSDEAEDRAEEEDARAYFRRNGRWPD
ncbi:MAG: hypothetical protein M0T77_07330 [Actinomycetota bacterium]|nr:hypothetical protein [Actinomycetota bacterium]